MVKHKGSPVTSSITVYLQTGKTAKQQPHEAFANLADDGAANFSREWGPISTMPMVEQAKLGWRDILRTAWDRDVEAVKEVQGWVNRYMVTSLKFSDGRIVMESDHLLGTIYLLFLRDHLSGRTAICANPDCEQPYFIKHRATQKFCECSACAAYGQREYAKAWWHREGKQQREQRRKKAQKGRK
jgi:hypothetical protein